MRHRYARCRRSAGVEGHITSERNASEPERSHVRPQAAEPTGPHREGEEPKPMMHGHEKSELRHSSNEAAEQGRATGSGGGGAKGGGQGEREPMPHVPDTVPGKRVTDAGARTEGRGQPSNIRGGSRMQESCTYGSGAARLAAIPAGASPANTRSPVHVVVIPSGREGDQTAESLEVKALWGRGDLVRSVKGGRATWQAVA